MFPISGQTAGRNGLNFFNKLMGSLGVIRLKKIQSLCFFFNFFSKFHEQRRALQLVVNNHAKSLKNISNNLLNCIRKSVISLYLHSRSVFGLSIIDC